MIDQYRHVPYVSGGRTMDGLDCWGLVRLVREEMTGQLLPEYGGVLADDKRMMTKAAPVVQSRLAPCEPKAGAIAFAYRGRLCIHVGVIVESDGRLWVFETNNASGMTLMPIKRFVARFSKVEFYD